MNVKEAINLRKSIRKYQDKQIPEEIIVELLDAARKAPSAKNTQSHRYFIVNDQGTKDKLPAPLGDVQRAEDETVECEVDQPTAQRDERV